MASYEPRAADFDCTVSQRRDPNLGTVLDGYRIDAKIAEGGFGSVYRARHLASGTDVALKILHAHFARDPNMTARFQREAATMSRLSNEHTVATHAVGEGRDGTLYIALELLHGECLHERLRRGPLRWQHAVAIARAICSSLAEAHALGVVHRDLKPANIHLGQRTDHVKVLDFGIVSVSGGHLDDGEDLTHVGMTVGTLDYMSPEQITDRPCDGRSDIYSLGVLLYEALTGSRPFSGLGGPQLLAAMLMRLPERPSALAAIPPALDRLVLTCLRREPRERYQDVQQLAAALAALGQPARSAPALPIDEDDEATTFHMPEPARSSSAVVPPPSMAHPAMLPMAANTVAMPALPRSARGSVAQGLGLVMPPAIQQPLRPSTASMGRPFEHAACVSRDRALGRMAILAALSIVITVVVAISHWM